MTAKKAGTAAGRGYRGRSAEELRAERRERLLNAAFAVVGEEGYARLSIDRVCAAARVTTRHYYEHFQGREALLHGLFERIENELWSIITRALTEPAVELERRHHDAIRSFVRHALSDPRRARILCLESVGVSPQMETRRRRLIRRIAGLIDHNVQQLVAAGVLPPADYYLQGIALVGGIHELLAEWLTGDIAIDVEGMELRVLQLFHSVIIGTAQTVAPQYARKAS